ncbi:MAG: ASCH domain-containing protein [Patescibacteria group bacterium]|nr:ASCH domain-containing protein [Patescibacteria group bacterium]
MKAITLYQPYAELMALGIKTRETRHCRIKYRGDICIHAALRQPVMTFHQRDALRVRGINPNARFVRGAIVAVVELYDCIPAGAAADEARAFGEWEFGDYREFRWAYLTQNLRRLPGPVFCAGMQSICWEVEAEIAEAVKEQLRLSGEKQGRRSCERGRPE